MHPSSILPPREKSPSLWLVAALDILCDLNEVLKVVLDLTLDKIHVSGISV